MIKVESIYPYTIVKEDDYYGITDIDGNIIIPCIMDEITNVEYEEYGQDSWSYFCCVVLLKNGKYGLFTDNGKFIEPTYDAYAIDPSDDEIHVRSNESYGILNYPDYDFEEIPAHCSPLSGIDYEEDAEETFIEAQEEADADDDSWSAWELRINILNDISARLHAFGYKYTQDLWNAAQDKNAQVNIGEFVASALSGLDDEELIKAEMANIKAQGDSNDIQFCKVANDMDMSWCANMAKRGVASFISIKGMAYANIPLLNRKISELLNEANKNGYDSLFRLIDRLLPCPEHRSFDIIPIQFQVGKRPSCRYEFFGHKIVGEIGEIYLFEHSMHMFSVCVNIYDSEDPEELIEENHILNVSDIVLSELLTSIQQEIDPTGENAELSAAISNAINIENGESTIAQAMTDCGVYILSLSDFERTPRYHDGNITGDVDYVYVSGNDVMLVIGEHTVPFTEQCGSYSWILEDIKSAANIAYKRSKM